MKIFIKALHTFFIPIVLFLVFFLTAMVLISKIVTSHSNQYDFDKNIEILFMGDSHITNTVIDSLIPEALNLSKRSEPYYYTFQKLKFLTKSSKINKLVLGYSYHNISGYYDEFINGHLSTVMPHKLFFTLDLNEQLRVINWNKRKILLLFKKIILSAYYQYFENKSKKLDYWFFDGYDNPFRESKVNLNSLEKRIKFQFYLNQKVINFADLNIHYFKKITSYCKERDIDLYLLETPLHKEYLNRVPSSFKSKLLEISSKENLQVINLENLNLSDSSFVPDGDHVSAKGSIITTNKLLEILKEK